MHDDKKIRDAFNKSSFENEDWLQPPDFVYDKIEEELFPEKKKNRKFFWWFFFGFVLLFGSYLTYNLLSGSNSVIDSPSSEILAENLNTETNISSSNLLEANEQISAGKSTAASDDKEESIKDGMLDETLDETLNETLNERNSDLSNVKIAVDNETALNQTGSQISTKRQVKHEVKHEVDREKLTEKNEEILGMDEKNAMNSFPSRTSTSDEKSNEYFTKERPNKNTSNNGSSSFAETKNEEFIDSEAQKSGSDSFQEITSINSEESESSTDNNSNFFLKENVIENEQSAVHPSLQSLQGKTWGQISPLQINAVEEESSDNKLDLQNLLAITPNELLVDNQKEQLIRTDSLIGALVNPHRIDAWQIGLEAGYSLWSLSLNNNYQTALQGADFTHSKANGFFAGINASKSISPILKLNANLTFERVSFESGHNSIVNYDPSTENAEGVNTFDLTMATPIGFLESNINLKNTETNLDVPKDVVLDLSNKHIASNLDFGLGLTIQAIDKGKINVGLDLGLGLNYLLSLENDFYSFTPNENTFEGQGSSLVSNQSDINKTRPYFMSGLNVLFGLNTGSQIGFAYSFKQDVVPLYQFGDYSTLLSRHGASVRWLKRF